ncbi:MAG: phage tail protein [Bauldia sp.]
MNPASIARLLPAVYQEAMPVGAESDAAPSVLSALLDVMAEMHRSTEGYLGDYRSIVEPWRAPPPFLDMLAGWLGLGPYLGRSIRAVTTSTALRELVSRAGELARNRGTADALLTICELVTGVSGFAVEEDVRDGDGNRIPFHFRLVAPAGSEGLRPELETIIRNEKPAFITAEIVVASAA